MVSIRCFCAVGEFSRVNFNPAGQIIGAATSVRRTKDVVLGMVEEYVDALERLQAVNEGVTA